MLECEDAPEMQSAQKEEEKGGSTGKARLALATRTSKMRASRIDKNEKQRKPTKWKFLIKSHPLRWM